jgi:hypothetical protein
LGLGYLGLWDLGRSLMSSSLTTNLQLFKATPGTAEKFRTTDVNGNWDKVDSAIGAAYTDVTAGTANNNATEISVFSGSVGPAIQGSAWDMRLCGIFAHSSTATTLTFRLKLGGSTVATWVVTTPASALSGRNWRIDAQLYCLTTGGSGTWKLSALCVATVNATDTPVIAAGNATKDTTVPQGLELTVQWGAANAANTFSCEAGYIRRVTNA